MFSCELCGHFLISKDTFFIERIRWLLLKRQQYTAAACNFSRNKLHRRHFSRKVLKAEAAFLFDLFESFWKRLENTFEMTTVELFSNQKVAESTQTQHFYLFCFKASGEVLPADYSGALLF